MKLNNSLTFSTSPSTRPARKLRLTARSLYRSTRRRYAGKEQDSETGLYYYGARYLDSKTGRWLSGDPAVSEYIPSAPVNDEARKRNGSLPGMGGVFNYANLHVYHYAGNNPVKYSDPDGNIIVNIVIGAGIGAVVGGVSGATSAIMQGKSVQEITGNALSGAISGAVTGGFISSGVGVVAVVGASFVGGAAGSVMGQVVSNGGTNGLNPQDVAKTAIIAGGISAVAATATLGISTIGNNIVNNAWNAAADLTTTTNGTWGAAALNAVNTRKAVATAKPVVEAIIGMAAEVANVVITESSNANRMNE
jgi:RHS repeat-associated protein